MTRLHTELQRLYLPAAAAPADTAAPGDVPGPADLLAADGRTRALVLALGRPADWAPLARVWQGVQAELALPAPGIAVSGRDGFQLWFSLAVPVPAAAACAFLQGLQARWLGEVDARRVDRWPRPDDAPTGGPRHAGLVPARQADGGRWSAFVAPDLAPVFADEPWLDLPPSPEGQAELLARLASIPAEDFSRALARLAPADAAAGPPKATPDTAAAGPAATVAGPHGPTAATTAPGRPVPARPGGDGLWQDPRDFLRAVMNDDAAPLAQRVEAARALLADAAR